MTRQLVEDLTGKHFGSWVVLERGVDRFYMWRGTTIRKVIWICECQCGSGVRKEVFGQSLRNKRSIGCGCARRAATAKRPFESLYGFFCATALKRQIQVSISYEDFLGFTKVTQCHYCAATVVWSKYNHGGKGNSSAYNLDRKDNGLPYTLDNVVVCCTRCNFAKGRFFTYAEWAYMAEALKRMPHDCAA